MFRTHFFNAPLHLELGHFRQKTVFLWRWKCNAMLLIFFYTLSKHLHTKISALHGDNYRNLDMAENRTLKCNSVSSWNKHHFHIKNAKTSLDVLKTWKIQGKDNGVFIYLSSFTHARKHRSQSTHRSFNKGDRGLNFKKHNSSFSSFIGDMDLNW